MARQTNIEWCDATFNPWIGCTKVGPGCDHCYAERSTPARALSVEWGPHAERRRTSAANWSQPLQWERQHDQFFATHGRRRRVFCASLADVFDNQVPASWRAHLFALIEQTPHLDWLLLTKRIGNVMPMLSEVAHSLFWMDRLEAPGLPENVWLGATVCNQQEADRDIPKLLALPVAKRFLSMEPLLGDVRLGSWLQRSPSAAVEAGRVAADMPAWTRIGSTSIDWVIVGGESGPHARPMHPDWARSLRDQCAAAGVPFLFKQWGSWRAAAWFDGPDADRDEGDAFVDLDRVDHVFLAADGRTWETNGGRHMYPPLPLGHWCLMVYEGKRATGRTLDARTHLEWPTR